MDTASESHMDVDAEMGTTSLTTPTTAPPAELPQVTAAGPSSAHREGFREIAVKVHIRRPEKDSWIYLGRASVSQQIVGQSSRVDVRALASGKIIASFGENSDLQAEKRGNFVVIGCVDGARVVSWSLNALNNSETLRLLASVELACYRCKPVHTNDPRTSSKSRRRVERIIKEDRRRRHRRRKDQDAMIDAFAKSNIDEAQQPTALADANTNS